MQAKQSTQPSSPSQQFMGRMASFTWRICNWFSTLKNGTTPRYIEGELSGTHANGNSNENHAEVPIRKTSTLAPTRIAVRVISSTTVQAPPSYSNGDSAHTIDLTPWDLQFLKFGSIQKGLLFRYPTLDNTRIRIIQHLKHSLSTTLSFFPPLAGALAIFEHQNGTVSSHIVCNNAGALFVHAVADNTTVTDILQPNYVPPIVHSFFALNGVKNYQGTSQPLLAVQVTELVDGIFIGCTINHVVSDGKSFWYFFNSWAEISRGAVYPSKLPSFERYFPDGIERPIRFPFTIEELKKRNSESPPPAERIFHFTKEKIAQLKSKANADVGGTSKISCLQALLTLLCRSVIRCKSSLDQPQEKVNNYMLTMDIDVRSRLVPTLPEEFFGNAVLVDPFVTLEVGELLESGGLGKGAMKINRMISSYTDENIKKHYESWLRSPNMATASRVAGSNNLSTSSSPRFDVYCNDFGWGKPVAVRSGVANTRNGKVTLIAGAEAGSIDIAVLFPHEILEALANDIEFADAISI